MANGYKLVDDPLEGILGNVLRLQQLQEGYDRAEQQKQDRYFNKLSSFQQNLTSNLTDSDAIGINYKMTKSYFDKNKLDMDSNMVAAYQDLLEMTLNQQKASAETNVKYRQYLEADEELVSLLGQVEDLETINQWSTPDSSGSTYKEKSLKNIAMQASMSQDIANNLQYLKPSQVKYFINESNVRQTVNDRIFLQLRKLGPQGGLGDEDIELLSQSPQLFLNKVIGEEKNRISAQTELLKELNSIEADLVAYEAALNRKSVWKPKDMQEFNLSGAKDDPNVIDAENYAASLQDRITLLKESFESQYNYIPTNQQVVFQNQLEDQGKPILEEKEQQNLSDDAIRNINRLDVQKQQLLRGKYQTIERVPTEYKTGKSGATRRVGRFERAVTFDTGREVVTRNKKNETDVIYLMKNYPRTEFFKRYLKNTNAEKKEQKMRFLNYVFASVSQELEKDKLAYNNISDEDLSKYFKDWFENDLDETRKLFVEADPKTQGIVPTKQPKQKSIKEMVDFYRMYRNER